MKNTFLKPVLQLAAILIASFGAVAFGEAPADSKDLVNVNGHMPGNCEETTIRCRTEQIAPFCKSGTITLYLWDGTGCIQPLYKIP